MRHTLFKILVCICLFLLFLITMIVSLPTIISNSIFGLDGTKPAEGATLMSAYTEMSGAVSDVVDEGYNQSLAYVDQLIADGGYDYDLSMDALVNYAQSSAGYDAVSYTHLCRLQAGSDSGSTVWSCYSLIRQLYAMCSCSRQ